MPELLTSEPVSSPELFALQACAVAYERQGEATEVEAFTRRLSRVPKSRVQRGTSTRHRT